MDKHLTKRQMAVELHSRLQSASQMVSKELTVSKFMNMSKQELTRWYNKARVITSGKFKGDVSIQ